MKILGVFAACLKTCVAKCPRAYGAGRRWRNLGVAAVWLAVVPVTAVAQGRITIAALGDSLTQGYGLPQEDGLVPQLNRWLAENGVEDVEIVNAGVSGDTSAGGLSRIAWTLTEDVDGLIVALGGNDVLRGFDPAQTRANLDGILAAIAARDLPVLLAGVPAPGNYGPEYKAQFDAIYPELAQKHDALLYPDMLAAIGGGDLQAARALMQPDGLHPNAEGVGRIVADIGPLVRELVAAARAD